MIAANLLLIKIIFRVIFIISPNSNAKDYSFMADFDLNVSTLQAPYHVKNNNNKLLKSYLKSSQMCQTLSELSIPH